MTNYDVANETIDELETRLRVVRDQINMNLRKKEIIESELRRQYETREGLTTAIAMLKAHAPRKDKG